MVTMPPLLGSGLRELLSGPDGPSPMYGSIHAEMACVTKNNDVVQHAEMCGTPNIANAWDAAHGQDVVNEK